MVKVSTILEQVKEKGVEVWLNSLVYGIQKDKSLGVVQNGRQIVVQAKQVILAAGAKETPKITMSGGTIRNSYVDDEEYIHIKKQGGAVYLEDGTFTMSGGTIKNCSAVQGGAVYIARKSEELLEDDEFNFKMEGGEI